MRFQFRVALALAAFSPLSPLSNVPVQAQNAPLDTMKNSQEGALILSRYRELLLEKPLANAAMLKKWLETLDANGQWPDIDYADTQPSDWKTKDHLVRVVALSLALAKGAPEVADSPRLWEATARALDWWLAARPKNKNWWHNEIGVPIMMRDIIVSLGDRLTDERRTKALEVLNQFGRPKSGNGANTIWEAELGIEYGALTQNWEMVSLYSKMIADEIKVTTGEGVQRDGSYHQHSARLQQFHYGGVFLSDGARLGWQLNKTQWAIPTEKMQVLTDMVINGNQWMVRGIYTVPGTIDRAVSRAGSLQSGDLRRTIRFLREAVPGKTTELDAIAARQDGKGAPIVGFRAFPRSDFATYHRPSFSFFVKTVSNRTLLTESINNENLKGKLLNQGDSYILRDGREYLEMPAVWDWDLLPGVTWAKDAGTIVRQPFVGSIGDGTSGATAMDIMYGAPNAPTLAGRKFWACHGDVVVALIGGLRAPNGTEPVRTALDQTSPLGPVGIGTLEKIQFPASPPVKMQQQVRWAYLNGMAYLPLGDATLTLQVGPQTGKWWDINKSGSASLVTKEVFLPVLEHGLKPDGQNSGYVLFSAPTAASVEKAIAKPTWRVLRNDANCQAVLFSDGTLMAAFWTAGTLDETGHSISVDAPCLMLESQGQIRVSDPTQKGGKVKLTLRVDNTSEVTLPAGGEASAPITRVRP